MWVFLSYGFFSITLRPGRRAEVQIRARRREHLDALRARHPELGEISESAAAGYPGADYPYRIFAHRRTWARVLKDEATEIQYQNFKAAVGDERLHAAVLHVWAILRSLLGDRRPVFDDEVRERPLAAELAERFERSAEREDAFADANVNRPDRADLVARGRVIALRACARELREAFGIEGP